MPVLDVDEGGEEEEDEYPVIVVETADAQI